MSKGSILRRWGVLVVAVVCAAGSVVSAARADEVTDAVAALRGAIASRLGASDVAAKEAAFLAKADSALAKFKGANDLADVKVLGSGATAIVKSGTADVPILTGLRTVAETCFAEAREDQLELEAKRDGLLFPGNVAKLDRKIDGVAAKLARGESFLGTSLTKSFTELRNVFQGSKLAATLAAKLDAAEEKLTALPTGLVISRAPTYVLLRNVLPGTTPEDRFLFRSITFSGTSTVDGEVFETIRASAADAEYAYLFENLVKYGLDRVIVYDLVGITQGALDRLRAQSGTERRLQGTFTMRLRRGYHGSFKNYVVPLNILL